MSGWETVALTQHALQNMNASGQHVYARLHPHSMNEAKNW
jgi:hypothetical protein